MSEFQVLNFYQFKELTDLAELKVRLRDALVEHSVYGTIIIAAEGVNASLCTDPANVAGFARSLETILGMTVEAKSSFIDVSPFRKQEVKIKPEIVTLRKDIDMKLGEGTHVDPADWNSIISQPDVLVLDTRNDYEFRSGTFVNAVNPETEKFSDLPDFVDANLDPATHRRVAMFCTGGIRCEKFAPFLRSKGFAEVYQLRGGILKYLEEVPVEDQLWKGECFVFDERITLNEKLEKGAGNDLSQRRQGATPDAGREE